MEEFIGKFTAWVIACGLTVGVLHFGEFVVVTAAVVGIVALIWFVIIWGGFLILDDLDF